MTFDKYVLDRQYTRNVSPKTRVWYADVWRNFGPYLKTDSAQSIRESVRQATQALLAKGIKPVSINSWLTGVRAYCLWLHQEGHLKERPRVQLLKCEQKVITTLSPEQIKRIVDWKPGRNTERRLHVLTLLLLDTGVRIQEALTLRKNQLDFDNLLIRIKGKGNKERFVPMSLELRKVLFRHIQRSDRDLVFHAANGNLLSQRNVLSDLTLLARKLRITGIRFSAHTLRHSFAVNYLRSGGNLYYLQRILGHSAIGTTQRYLQSLGATDLRAVHDRLSLLSR